VPYDPYTPYVFWGEEFSRTARYFTHGYDIYTPPRTLIAHDYKHTQGNPEHFKWNGKGGARKNDEFESGRAASSKRIFTLLGMPGGDDSPEALAALGEYGLGTRRTLAQLRAFTGIDLTKREVTANRCGNIDWVPWAGAANVARAVATKTGPPPQQPLGGAAAAMMSMMPAAADASADAVPPPRLWHVSRADGGGALPTRVDAAPVDLQRWPHARAAAPPLHALSEAAAAADSSDGGVGWPLCALLLFVGVFGSLTIMRRFPASSKGGPGAGAVLFRRWGKQAASMGMESPAIVKVV
jgi:hypothetical protein